MCFGSLASWEWILEIMHLAWVSFFPTKHYIDNPPLPTEQQPMGRWASYSQNETRRRWNNGCECWLLLRWVRSQIEMLESDIDLFMVMVAERRSRNRVHPKVFGNGNRHLYPHPAASSSRSRSRSRSSRSSRISFVQPYHVSSVQFQPAVKSSNSTNELHSPTRAPSLASSILTLNPSNFGNNR